MGAGGGNPMGSLNHGVGQLTGSGGIGGFFSNLTGQQDVANAEGAAANAQLQQEQADRTQAMNIMMPTASELGKLQQALAVNQQSIGQAQSLINSADPALVQAAQQAQALMQGKSAASLAPIQNQRDQQKAQLKQQLQQQLGPGYETSSAGIQALNNFDQQTANLMTQAQQSTIGQYLGYAGAGAQLGMGQQQAGIGNYQNLTNQEYGFQKGQVGALMATPVNPGLKYSGQIASTTAGQNFGLGGVVGLFGSTGKAFSSWGGGSGGGGAAGGAGGGMAGGAADSGGAGAAALV